VAPAALGGLKTDKENNVISKTNRQAWNGSLQANMPAVPCDSIVALTFLPSTPHAHFGSWLQPVGRVMLAALFDPGVLGLTLPGQLLFAGIRPVVRSRIAMTEWSTPAFIYCLSEEALVAQARDGLSCPRELAAVAVSMHAARQKAAYDISRLSGRPHLPRTLCAVDPSAVIESAPSKVVWDYAHENQLTLEESNACLYERWCISPRSNYTKKLLVDTRLLCRLDCHRGFPGVRNGDQYLETGRLVSRPLPAPTALGPVCASPLVQTWLLSFSPSFGSLYYREARATLRIDRHIFALLRRTRDAA
jgi:hypothetical protein